MQGNDESDTLHRVGLCTPQGTWGWEGRGVVEGKLVYQTAVGFPKSKILHAEPNNSNYTVHVF